MKEFKAENKYRYKTKHPVSWIISHTFRYPLFPLLVILASIGSNTGYAYISMFIGRTFDLITTPSWLTEDLIKFVILILGATLLQGVSGLTRSFSMEFLAQRIERDSRDELYESLLGKSQTFHGKQRVGDIMARATNDIRALNLMFNPGIMLIVDSFMNLIVPIILIMTIHRSLLLVPLLFILGLILTVYDYNRQLKPVSIAQREKFGKMNAGLAEALEGIEVVKANIREKQEWMKFSQNAKKYRDLFIKQGIIQACYWPLFVFSIAWAAALFHSLLLWKKELITLGEVVAFIGLMGALKFPTFISIFSFNLVQLGMASARRILEMINATSELDENSQGTEKIIQGNVEFRSVTFSYNGNRVLKNISFTAIPGETIAIVGQTGSGKTTLTHLINRIFDTENGTVLVDGIDVKKWSLESLRSQISMIEQDIFLYSRTLTENIAFGCPDATEKEVIFAAKEAQADSFISNFNKGYQTIIGERGVTLSGGQKQRIAIARAFLTDPRILILDDSTSAIDSATEDEIQKAMKKISRERTTFIITHRLSQIRWADRILVLKQGEIMAQGTHSELLENCAEYKRIYANYS